MALKKSELYSSLWASCDELRGGMDASQYKDYVLVLLFIKYVSDKYAGIRFAPVTIPEGSSFQDMVALKGKSDIGDQINKKIIAPLAKANNLSDFPDFNEASKLGSGKEMVDRLTNLIGIFENPALDFSKNRADGDDILGDAYEYLMRHFATESGKSKGQFYTPAEVSRIMAQILGIRTARTTSETTVYDPTCGSGSLLLKVADEAMTKPTLYGQEKDAATSALARMNMYLHNNPTALIMRVIRSPIPSSLREAPSKPSTTLSPTRRSPTSAGAQASISTATRMTDSGLSALRQPNKATTPTCCTSSVRSRAQVRALAFCPTACSFGVTPRPTSAAIWSVRDTSRPSSDCLRISSMGPASRPASSSSTSMMPIPARQSSSSTPVRAT